MRKVTAAIIEDQGRLLLARRAPGSKLAGFWEFPGGKVEEGESTAECLTRELREELGISCEVDELVAESVFHYDHGAFRILAYRTRIIRGEIALVNHDKIAWVPLPELLRYELLPADKPIAQHLQADSSP